MVLFFGGGDYLLLYKGFIKYILVSDMLNLKFWTLITHWGRRFQMNQSKTQDPCLKVYLSTPSKYLASWCLNPQTPPEKAFRGSKHLLTRYLEDFGRLGYIDS